MRAALSLLLLVPSLAAATPALVESPAQPPAAQPDAQALTEAPAGGASPGQFTRIHVAGAVDLDLTGGASSHEAAVDCPTKDGPGVQLTVKGDTLYVTPKHEGRRLGSCSLKVSAPRIVGVEIAGAADVEGRRMVGLEDLVVAGAGDFELEGIESTRLRVQISGAGEAELSGKVDALTVSIAGAGEVEARGLTSRTAQLSIAGAGDLEATVTEAVQASMAGAGDIDIYGKPKSVQKQNMGIGSIKVH